MADGLFVGHVRGAGEIAPRAKVCTSGLGGVFPAGIAVGTFAGGADSPRRPGLACERAGKVLPAVDYQTLEDVFIRR